MSRLLFRMRHVPDEEARAVRELLDRHGVGWFETGAGRWGLAFPAIWVARDEEFARARRLLDEWQAGHGARMRRLHALRRERGEAPTLRRILRERPLFLLGRIALIGLVLFLSLWMFLSF